MKEAWTTSYAFTSPTPLLLDDGLCLLIHANAELIVPTKKNETTMVSSEEYPSSFDEHQ